MAIQVRPVTAKELDPFDAFFSAKGCPGFCWCAAYRFKEAHTMNRVARRKAMRALISDDVPVGVLAIDGEETVGWCSIAPRSTHGALTRSRSMPMVDEDAWTIVCLFVRAERRGTGVARALVAGAVKYAREEGARLIEAYPWDTAGLSPTGPAAHWGHSRTFAQAGFRREGESRRWVRRLRPPRKQSS